MRRGTLILGGLLVAQLGLAGVLAMSGSDYAAFDAKEPLLAFDTTKIDQISIDQAVGGGSVTLKKENGKWVIPSFAGFPADPQKVTAFLDKLRELKKGFPVATSSDAANRFKVGDSTAERRIVLSSGGKEAAKLLVGTSPSFRQANVRADGSSIYSVAFSAYEAGLRGDDWMDRGALAIPADQVSSVSFPGVTLEHKDGKFALAGVKDGETVADVKVQAAGNAALRPAFDVIQGKGAEEKAKLEPADIRVEVKKTDGTARIYTYKKEAAGGAYLFAVSDQDYVFRVAEASIAAITDATREKLIEQPKEQPKPEQQSQPAPQAQPGAQPQAGQQSQPAKEAQPAPAPQQSDAAQQSQPDAQPQQPQAAQQAQPDAQPQKPQATQQAQPETQPQQPQAAEQAQPDPQPQQPPAAQQAQPAPVPQQPGQTGAQAETPPTGSGG
jgi:hypothetical protein